METNQIVSFLKSQQTIMAPEVYFSFGPLAKFSLCKKARNSVVARPPPPKKNPYYNHFNEYTFLNHSVLTLALKPKWLHSAKVHYLTVLICETIQSMCVIRSQLLSKG